MSVKHKIKISYYSTDKLLSDLLTKPIPYFVFKNINPDSTHSETVYVPKNI